MKSGDFSVSAGMLPATPAPLAATGMEDQAWFRRAVVEVDWSYSRCRENVKDRSWPVDNVLPFESGKPIDSDGDSATIERSRKIGSWTDSWGFRFPSFRGGLGGLAYIFNSFT